MLNQKTTVQQTIRLIGLLAMMALSLAGCSATRVETTTGNWGTPVTEADMLQAVQRPNACCRLNFTKHLAGTWQVPLSGLLNLKNPKAVAAGLKDRDEPIEIYVYSLQHPTKGSFLVDSGLAETLRDPATNKDISSLVKRAMNTDELVTRTTTGEIINSLNGIDGVFLTHLHLDHILGLQDIATTVPVYVGPGEAQLSTFMNLFTQGTTDRLLGKVDQLLQWPFNDAQILDVFGDSSLFAIKAPGHTPGTTAYLANTTRGLHLMIGDVTHTRWGWEHSVEPGTFSHDVEASAASLDYIKRLADQLPNLQVHPGHQSLSSQ